jgi:hypothetical protein
VHKVHMDCDRHVHQASLRSFRHVVFTLLDLSCPLHCTESTKAKTSSLFSPLTPVLQVQDRLLLRVD